MPIKIKKMIICDGIREEKSGKYTIVGMYHDDTIYVLVPIPYIHPSLGIFIFGEVDKKVKNMVVKIVDPQDGILVNLPAQSKIDGKDTSDPSVFNIILNTNGLPFNYSGEYKIFLTADDEEISTSFFVKQQPPSTKEN